MPISEKILTEINEIDTTSEMKILMMDILNLEDNGVFRWKSEYEALIKDYLKKEDKKQ